MAEYRLRCFGESGNAHKAALGLTLAGVEWEPVFVDFFKGATRTPEFRALNPMGEVPVLETPTGTLSQSGAILAHLCTLTDQFGSASDPAVLRWLLWDNHKGSTAQGMLRFLRNFLPEDKRNADVIAFQQGRVDAALSVLNAHLSTRDWLAGDDMTIADLSACGYLYYPEPFGYDPETHTAITAWLDRIKAKPGWLHPYDLMPRA
jgi:glutathione S-transferase